MKRPPSPEEVQRRVAALGLVGFGNEEALAVMREPTQEARAAALAALLKRLRRRYRARVRELHPDLHQGDPDTKRDLQTLIAAWADLEAWVPQALVQRPIVFTVEIVSSSSTTGSTIRWRR